MLVFVGAKMLLIDVYKIPIGISLGVIALLIAAGVIGSLLFPKREAEAPIRKDEAREAPWTG